MPSDTNYNYTYMAPTPTSDFNGNGSNFTSNADIAFEEFCKKYFSKTDGKFLKKSTRRLTSNPTKPPHVKDVFSLSTFDTGSKTTSAATGVETAKETAKANGATYNYDYNYNNNYNSLPTAVSAHPTTSSAENKAKNYSSEFSYVDYNTYYNSLQPENSANNKQQTSSSPYHYSYNYDKETKASTWDLSQPKQATAPTTNGYPSLYKPESKLSVYSSNDNKKTSSWDLNNGVAKDTTAKIGSTWDLSNNNKNTGSYRASNWDLSANNKQQQQQNGFYSSWDLTNGASNIIKSPLHHTNGYNTIYENGYDEYASTANLSKPTTYFGNHNSSSTAYDYNNHYNSNNNGHYNTNNNNNQYHYNNHANKHHHHHHNNDHKRHNDHYANNHHDHNNYQNHNGHYNGHKHNGHYNNHHQNNNIKQHSSRNHHQDNAQSHSIPNHHQYQNDNGHHTRNTPIHHQQAQDEYTNTRHTPIHHHQQHDNTHTRRTPIHQDNGHSHEVKQKPVMASDEIIITKSHNLNETITETIKPDGIEIKKTVIEETTIVQPITEAAKKRLNFGAEFKSGKKQSFDRQEDPPAAVVNNDDPPAPVIDSSVRGASLKVVACGMKKDARLPIPKANYFLEKGNFGDDAGFWSENDIGSAMGLADGATGNLMLGYDPGEFPRYLMKLCSNLFLENPSLTDSKELLMKAFDILQDKTCYGSCTACVLTYDKQSSELNIANIGDSGYRLLRNGKILHKSEPMRISNDCPRQVDSYPWKAESRKMGVSYTEILGNDAFCETLKTQKNDVIILSSDGLYDNITDEEIEEIFNKSKSVMDACEKLVTQAVKHYRKPDDILIMIGKIIDRPLSKHSIYSKESKN